MFSAFKKALQVLSFLAGIALFVWVLRVVGTRKLLDILPAMASPTAWTVFLWYALINFCDSAAWQVLCPKHWMSRRRWAWKDFYLIRVTGEGVNGMTPFVDIGGEFIKVALTAGVFGISKKEASVGVILARTTYFFSEILFWMTGLVPVLWLSGAAASGLWGAGLTILVCLALAGLLYLWQKRGFFKTLRLPFADADEAIASFYGNKKKPLALSIFYHWLGWVAGGVETYFMFHALGAPITLWQGIAAEALLQIVKTGSFFIPGNLGAQEAGVAWFASNAGLDPSYGVAVSLLKRARQWIWAAIGLVIWGLYYAIMFRHGKNTPAQTSPQ